MKKIILVGAMLALLASCGANTNTQTGSTHTGTTNTTTPSADVVGSGTVASVYYSLRDTDANGAVIDANMDENGNPTKDAFSVDIDAKMVIPGFEKALIGMRAGETKTVSVAPEDGYVAQTNTQDVPFEDVAPVFSITEDKSAILGLIKEEIPLTDTNKSLFEGKNIGDTISETDGVIVKLLEKKETTAMVEIQQTNSPFFGKELTIGMIEEIEGITFKVTSITEDKVTLEVTNINSPFYKKDATEQKIAVGDIAEFEQNQSKMTVKILEINEVDGQKTVKIEQTLTPELAGKTLHFTIKVDKISLAEKTPALDLSNILPAEATTATQEKAQ